MKPVKEIGFADTHDFWNVNLQDFSMAKYVCPNCGHSFGFLKDARKADIFGVMTKSNIPDPCPNPQPLKRAENLSYWRDVVKDTVVYSSKPVAVVGR